jgi:predicted metal-binding membrane protein
MIFPFAIPDRPDAATLRHFFWSHPQWWAVGISVVAWVLLIQHGLTPAVHELHRGAFAQEVWNWMLMVAAMMLPLVIDRVQTTAGRSLWKRRHRAIAGFLSGYFLPWLLLGLVIAGLRQVSWTQGYVAPAVSFIAAVLWQRSRLHRRALAECHRSQPLAPAGWRADLDCLRFGGKTGAACVSSCWPLMVGCAFTGHSLIAMAGGMAVGVLERRSHRPAPLSSLLAAGALAACYVLLAVLNPRTLAAVHLL